LEFKTVSVDGLGSGMGKWYGLMPCWRFQALYKIGQPFTIFTIIISLTVVWHVGCSRVSYRWYCLVWKLAVRGTESGQCWAGVSETAWCRGSYSTLL